MCEEYIAKAKSFVTGAIAAFAAAPVFVLVAIGLNGGFFTAPGAPIPMLAAAAAAGGAVILLRQAISALKDWVICGGASPDCAGELSNIENALAGAATSIGILAASCAGVAAVAWIPWIAQPGMWIVYGALLVGAATLAALVSMWSPLDRCQSRVASSRGPLMPGEKASDPWFLRLSPVDGASYAMPLDAKVEVEDFLSSRWVRCAKLKVGKWQIQAIADIKGTPAAPLTFQWMLQDVAIPSTSFTSDPNQSTLSFQAPTSTDMAKLSVTAVDRDGFKSTRETELYLGEAQMACQSILPLVPVQPRSPILPWTEERLRPALEGFNERIQDIIKKGDADIPR